ncbi:beta-ketoacyl synthase [Paraconexibacter sp.]|uniref:beta-ketoacyl-[acyl-carrier-protein] synthase family protein n=1 Tax=Paraconexibacter sp. TaxID=2949640 RepID=UPI003565DBCA
MTRVVVTGVGAVTPLGVGAAQLHEGWSAARSGIADGVGACTDFEPTTVLSRKEARRADRCTQLALTAAQEALEQAGYAGGLPYDPTRIACVLGTGIGGVGTLEHGHDMLRDRGPGKVPPLSVPMMMPNAPAGQIAMHHGLRGESYGVVSACAAGAHAIGAAMRMVRAGDADAVVCGGAESALTPLTHAAFAALDATSPSGISRPFDARRDGFVMGEGAGVLVLEREEDAVARGATILGVVAGYGATSDAHHLTAPHPDGEGAAMAIARALMDASLRPDDVDYVNAHGTSTPLNDRAETHAIVRALGDRAGEVPVSSLKSAIGHLLGAAGAVESIATVLALRDGVAPPTLGWEEREEGMDLDYVPGAARSLPARDRPAVAISNSFGFGGHNAVVCLQAVAA